MANYKRGNEILAWAYYVDPDNWRTESGPGFGSGVVFCGCLIAAKPRRWTCVSLTLGHRRRRWPSVKLTQAQRMRGLRQTRVAREGDQLVIRSLFKRGESLPGKLGGPNSLLLGMRNGPDEKPDKCWFVLLWMWIIIGIPGTSDLFRDSIIPL